MRFLIFAGYLAVAAVSVVNAQQPFSTDSLPTLKVKRVEIPGDRSQPLTVTFELLDNGKDPVAIAQKQFSLHISTQDQPFLIESDLVFSKELPKVFTVDPGRAITVSAQSS